MIPKRIQRCMTLAMAGALALFAAGCSGGGGGGGGGSLRVVEFVAGGTTEFVFRNEPLVFVFSNDIDPDSVSINGLQVRQGTELVHGRIEVNGNEILWSPVVLPDDRNDYTPPNNPPINGLGFLGGTRYTVQMLGGTPFSIQTKSGRPLQSTFSASFVTSDDFLPEENPAPPDLLGTPIFDPPPLVDGNPFSSNRADWPILDPSEVAIRLEFTERLDPSKLDPFESMILTNISEGVVAPGVGEAALVRLIQSPTADAVTIEPIVSLGDRPRSTEPYDFEVRITPDITDLAGNPLPRDIVFHFRTADKFGEPNYRVVTETFDDTDFRDDSQTNAKWGSNGVLEGADVMARTVTFIPMLPRGGIPGIPPPNTFNLPHPLVEVGNMFTVGATFMMRFFPGDVSAVPGESIVGMNWAPKSRFAFFSDYENITLSLGHTDVGSLQFEYQRNYTREVPNNPQVVFQGSYRVDANTDARWVPWPEFQRDFEYNTNFDLVFFWDMPEGGTTFQLFKNDSTRTVPRNRLFANGGDTRARSGRENTQYEFQFELVTKRSFGVSRAYGTAFNGEPLNDTDYGGFLVIQEGSSAGTTTKVQWAGATMEGDTVLPDAFVDNIDAVDGRSAIAFKVDMEADPFTGIVPRIRSVSFAVADRQPDDI